MSAPPRAAPHWCLERDAFGRLVFNDRDGQRHEGVAPVRAFALTAPDEGLSLVAADGRELVWIAQLSALPPTERTLIEQELAAREFAPVIERILSVSTYSTPSVWEVQTDRGDTRLVLQGEEDIRRVGGNALLIQDRHGIAFRVRDRLALDRHSKRLLERFL